MNLEPFSSLVGAVLLLALSIYTMVLLRQEPKGRFLRVEERFLFEGKSASHGLASSLGALFSVTYFFGAVFIYGNVFGHRLIWIAGVIVILSGFVFFRRIREASRVLGSAKTFPARSNLLLDFARARYPSAFQSLLGLFTIIYLGLLVEELAVSRLVLTQLFAGNPLIGGAALFVICLVVYVYLAYGGFKAVLASDMAQLLLLLPFLAILAYLVWIEPDLGRIPPVEARMGVEPQVASQIGLILIGVVWLSVSVDAFSRLNFSARSAAALEGKRLSLVLGALTLLFVFLILGILFGIHLRDVLAAPESPSRYTAEAVAYFMGSSSPIIRAIFFSGIICAIFTTTDSLLVTFLQVSWYRRRSWWGRRNLGKALLLAAILSSLMPADSVSAVGIFIASLLMLPAMSLVVLPLADRWKWVPKDGLFMWIGLGVSVALFGLEYGEYELAFERHFELPLIVCAAGLMGLGLSIGVRRRIHRE